MISNQRGQTLLEILLAFSVSILILSAVIFGVVTSLNNVQYTKNQGLANSYAQEGMAIIRQIKDSGWNNFLAKETGNYCIEYDSKELGSPVSADCGQNVGIFSREATIEHDSSSCCSKDSADDPGCVKVGSLKGSKSTVKVSWSDSKCPAGTGNPYCHNVELITCFSNIDKRQSP